VPIPHIPPGGGSHNILAQAIADADDVAIKPFVNRLARPAVDLPRTGANCCCGGQACILFSGCNGAPLEGVVVNFYDRQGGTLLAGPITTGADGLACPMLAKGTYWVDPTAGEPYSYPLDKYIWAAKNINLPAKGNVLWGVSLISGWGCCSNVNFPLPTTLYLTVCGQTYTLTSGVGASIYGWAPIGTPTITIPNAGVVFPGTCDWNIPLVTPDIVPWAIRLLCPSNSSTMVGETGVCGIGHFNGAIGGFDGFAISPSSCGCGIGIPNFFTCCNGGCGPGPSVAFTLTGTMGDMVNLTGSMPGSMPSNCVFPPAAPWPLPCAGDGITVTN